MTLGTYVSYPWAYGGSSGGSGGGDGDGDCCGDCCELICVDCLGGFLKVVGAIIAGFFAGLYWIASKLFTGVFAAAKGTGRGAVAGKEGIAAGIGATFQASGKAWIYATTAPWNRPYEDSGLTQAELRALDGMTNTYEYKELSRSGREVRLLELEPAYTSQMKVICREQRARLGTADCPSYEAVSYRWSNSNIKDVLQLNGQKAQFPASAVSALRLLRHLNKRRLVWIDAVCINQIDDEERGHQVAMMGDIYRGASRVLIWLGDSGISTLSFQSITTSLRQLNDQAEREVIEQRLSPRELMFSCNGNVYEPRQSATPWPRRTYTKELRAFFAHSWFTRLWIVQEAALARKATFYCGQHSRIGMLKVLRAAAWLQHKMLDVDEGVRNAAMIWRYADREHGVYSTARRGKARSWQKPRRGIALHRRHRIAVSSTALSAEEDLMEKQDAISDTSSQRSRSSRRSMRSNASKRTRLRTTQRSQQRFLLASILRDFQSFEAREPHDKIYSLLGLTTWHTTEIQESLLSPNYTRDIIDVYRDAARASILQTGHLDVLGIMPHFCTGSGPSWVPDWQQKRSDQHAENFAMFFRAAGKTRALCELLEPTDNNTLRLSGLRVDEVLVISELFPKSTCQRLLSFIRLLGSDILPLLNAAAMLYDTPQVMSNVAKGLNGPLGNQIALTLVAGATDTRYQAKRQQSHKSHWTAFRNIYNLYHATPTQERSRSDRTWLQNYEDKEGETNATRFLKAARAACVGRRLFVTKHGRVGLGPQSVVAGDQICVLHGGRWPFVLRSKDDKFSLVGPAYAHDIMDGEIEIPDAKTATRVESVEDEADDERAEVFELI